MYKIIALLIVITLTSAITIVSARSNNSSNNSSNSNKNNTQSNNNSQEKNDGKGNKNKLAAEDSTPSAQPTCDPNANWKNHGEYVSCVARLKQGGKTVSEAARSDIGKKNSTASASISPSPSATSSASASASPSNTPMASGSGELEETAIVETLKGLISPLQHLLDQIRALFSL